MILKCINKYKYCKSNIVVSFEQVESPNESLSISLKRLEAD